MESRASVASPEKKPNSDAADTDGLDLEAQLDLLLNQIEQTEPDILPPEVSPGNSPGSPETSSTSQEFPSEAAFSAQDADQTEAMSPPHEDDEPHADAQDPVGLDLAAQIQQLLDDDRGDASPAVTLTGTPPRVDPHEEVEAAPAMQPEQAASHEQTAAAPAVFEQPPPPQEDTSQDASTDPSDTDSDADPVLSIDDIDQMLAQEADQAVAGDFHSVHDVLGGQETESSTTSDDPQADMMAQPVDPDGFDGSFDAPDELLDESSTSRAGYAADAQAVARELDDQPEHRQPPSTTDPADDDPRPGRLAMLRDTGLMAIQSAPSFLKQLCATINRPLAGMTPHSRDMVGYVGLITVFWGSVTLAGKIILTLLR